MSSTRKSMIFGFFSGFSDLHEVNDGKTVAAIKHKLAGGFRYFHWFIDRLI